MTTDTPTHLNEVAAELRLELTRLIDTLAGSPARPVRLMRQAGLDKSLASRLVKATKSDSDLDFLHLVPSPTGLRILQDAARSQISLEHNRSLAHAVDKFQTLIDTLPGGRQALDAQLGQSSVGIRARREQMARQASFKAVSFLFGHYCETVTTALFVVPREDGEYTDMVEVHRRIGLQRITPGTAVPLLSLHTMANPELPQIGPQMTRVTGEVATQEAADYLIAEASSLPLPELQVERDGQATIFVLPGESAEQPPARLTTTFRVARANRIKTADACMMLRIYLLNTPCHRLVRDVYLAEGLWPQAEPMVNFYLPGPSGSTLAVPDASRRHYRQLNLSASIERLAPGPSGMALSGVPDQVDAMQQVLTKAGLSQQAFRGWRCEMSYPVPLIEMQMALKLA
jgi:hypothetical protein